MPMLTPKEAYMRVQAVYDQGRYRSALKLAESLYRQMPHHPPVVVLYTATLLRMQQPEKAAMIAKRALQTVTNYHHRTLIITSLCEAMNQLQSFDQAVQLLKKESENRPDDPYLISALVQILVIQNKHDEALALTDAAMARGLCHLEVATGFGRAAMKSDRQDEAAACIEEAIAQDDPNLVSTRSSAYTILGHLRDKGGNYDQAFDAYTKRNELYTDTYNDEMAQTRCAQIQQAWTPESFVGIPRPKPFGPRPVFIVGMPRSGTTLTEQILDAHPNAFGAGELEVLRELYLDAAPNPQSAYTTGPAGYNPEHVAKIAEQYRNELVRHAGSDQFAVISDKAPANYWYIGFIALAFPDAKIVHCLRDPRDTCLSCYFQPLDPSHSFSFDLHNCGSYYRHYYGFVKHMTAVLKDPRVGVDVFEMQYEDTVADLETQTRRLLDFVGLDFHEDCLNFHQSKRIAMTLSNDQVRKPIYASSTKRYERYAKHIAPLIDALGDLVPANESSPRHTNH